MFCSQNDQMAWQRRSKLSRYRNGAILGNHTAAFMGKKKKGQRVLSPLRANGSPRPLVPTLSRSVPITSWSGLILKLEEREQSRFRGRDLCWRMIDANHIAEVGRRVSGGFIPKRTCWDYDQPEAAPRQSVCITGKSTVVSRCGVHHRSFNAHLALTYVVGRCSAPNPA